MGLDMYLTGKKYLPRNYDNPDLELKEDGFRVSEKSLDLGYWRKHPNLHGFIVHTFAGGEDNCEPIRLTTENLLHIIESLKGNVQLPETQGFFFGKSEGTQEEREEDIAIFEDAVKWVSAKDNTWKHVEYLASW